jgi:2-methylisocitrate lyase-like PEP mutase family enzyme
MSKRTTRLRQLLADSKILVAFGAYDATGARLVHALGFKAVYMSGFETSASLLGQPDVGYLTATEMMERVAARVFMARFQISLRAGPPQSAARRDPLRCYLIQHHHRR